MFRLFRVDDNYALPQYLAYALIGTGLLVLLIGFFGCCGAVKESKCLLGAYFAFLFVILACELAIGIFALIFQDKVLTTISGNESAMMAGRKEPVLQLAQQKTKRRSLRQ
ncbi:hypothetical protein HPB48_004994 [Haemaphysalis longicornis]|uniref:Tetraspanin n=1 Tax=Haemaphysalis longicornis TaxID=44386 RepID=A0A9J6GEM8_HAELO|nr:hypothetical protein HPB48_004994 [Haemaphysalis longicornis]